MPRMDQQTKIRLSFLKDCLTEILNFSFDESSKIIDISSNEIDNVVRNPIQFRQKLLREQGFLRFLANILTEMKGESSLYLLRRKNKILPNEARSALKRRMNMDNLSVYAVNSLT